MKTFLEYVAADVIGRFGTDLSRVAVVFPNKRASLFLNEHLARMAGKPIWSPAYITISDLFRQHSELTVADPIKLICDLHKSFTRCTGIDETLDHFYGYGQLLLADFDDIDKNMADARKVFANLRDIHELDDTSFLTAQQVDVLKRFFANFSEQHNSKLKQKFLQLWSHFYDIYNDYRQLLRQQDMAYEGMIYREVAETDSLPFRYDCYLFVGFNMMQRAEQTLCQRLKEQGKALFYWDFDHYYMNTLGLAGDNEAGRYIRLYQQHFPNALDSADTDIYANFLRPKQVSFISAATENAQARYVGTWLRQNSRIADGRRTAIVLCNEGLLPAVIHCLPPEVEKVNITTGYPLEQSPLASLLSHLIALQTVGYAPSRNSFRLRYVNAVLRHPYSHYISEQTIALRDKLNKEKNYYPTPAQLATDAQMQLLFQPLTGNLLPSMAQWLLQMVRMMAHNCSADDSAQSSPLLHESFFRLYTLLNRLNDLIQSGDLLVDIITFQRLLSQLVQTTSIPFHGEPAEGIQLMGVLETRNLDFDHLLILSCNEGNMPRGVDDASFIPYTLRKAFGLTTVDNKVAIYAYYFNRLLQRASDVTILYNNSTEDGHTGEMSRFMLQLMVESPHTIERHALQTGQMPLLMPTQQMDKTDDVLQRIHAISFLSPSAINNYLKCPLLFYYYNVVGLREEEYNDDDEIDNRIFGNIFHLAAELIYRGMLKNGHVVTQTLIDELLNHPERIEIIVDKALRQELFHLSESSAKLPPLNGLQIIKRQVIIRYLQQLLRLDRELTPFTIAGLEMKVEKQLTMGPSVITIGGVIDRLDIVGSEADGTRRIRVVDYKTGHIPKKTPADVEAIFNPDNMRDAHTNYYLQAFFYSLIVSENERQTGRATPPLPVSPALLYILRAASASHNPTLKLGGDTIDDIERCRTEFSQHINRLLAEIFNPQVPFFPTDNRDHCVHCPYKLMCRR